MVFKGLNNLSPSYISELLVKKTESSRSLRSDNKNLLVVPRSYTVRYGDRNFRNVGPKMWNDLPLEMRVCDDVDAFKKMLKTLLFQEVYG